MTAYPTHARPANAAVGVSRVGRVAGNLVLSMPAPL